jgi:hypothetical protein
VHAYTLAARVSLRKWLRYAKVSQQQAAAAAVAQESRRKTAGLWLAAQLLDAAAAARTDQLHCVHSARHCDQRSLLLALQHWQRTYRRAAAAAELRAAAAALLRARKRAAAVALWRQRAQQQRCVRVAHAVALQCCKKRGLQKGVQQWRRVAAVARVKAAQRDAAALHWGRSLLTRVLAAWRVRAMLLL